MPAYDHSLRILQILKQHMQKQLQLKTYFHTPYGPEIKRGIEAWEAHKPYSTCRSKRNCS